MEYVPWKVGDIVRGEFVEEWGNDDGILEEVVGSHPRDIRTYNILSFFSFILLCDYLIS